MSGIEEIKKKAKLSMDEMYEVEQVGNMANQKAVQPDTQQPIQTSVKKVIQQANTQKKKIGKEGSTAMEQPYLKPKTFQPETETSKQPEIQSAIQIEIQKSEQPNTQPLNQLAESLIRQAQPPKSETYKMTFVLPEQVYKEFNDLYAKRMLQGRKTEKSNLICEAIGWLLKMEVKINL